MGCDMGFGELLGLDLKGSFSVVGMYFETAADAKAFVEALGTMGHTVAERGLVYTICVD
jgi:hypothetical protein